MSTVVRQQPVDSVVMAAVAGSGLFGMLTGNPSVKIVELIDRSKIA